MAVEQATLDQLAEMSTDQIRKAYETGALDELLGKVSGGDRMNAYIRAKARGESIRSDITDRLTGGNTEDEDGA